MENHIVITLIGEFMMIKKKYNANEDVDIYQSLSHKVIYTQMNAKKRYSEKEKLHLCLRSIIRRLMYPFQIDQ